MPISYEKPMDDVPTTLHADGNQYGFVPDANGSFNAKSKNNTFDGALQHQYDEDWVIIELKAGTTYQIDVMGRHTMDTDDDGENDAGGASDTVLKLLDSKGGVIDMNDDINPGGNPNPTNLNSRLKFAPEEDGIYYISVSAYTGNPSNDTSGGYQITVTELDLPVDIEGGMGDDKLVGTDAGEEIAGGVGNDSLYGMGGDDELDGGPGKDLLVGGPGADMLNGGGPNDPGDTVSYVHSPAGVTINLLAGVASGGNAEGDTLGEDIENVQGSMHDDDLTGDKEMNSLWGLGGNDELSGGRGIDMLYGGMGDDDLDGGDGKDTLEGGYGADELTGGDGDDTASYTRSMMGVTVRLHANQAMGGDAEGDVFVDMTTVEYDNPDPEAEPEERVLEETVPDIVNLTGSAMADILAGDSRANTIMGMGGDDKIYGGPGGGNDILHGDDGDDMIFGGIGDDTLAGGAGDDRLVGGAGVDTFYGGAGSDMIYAESTSDVVNGWLITAVDDGSNGGTSGDGIIDNPGPYTGPLDDPATTDADENEGSEAYNDPMAVDTVSFEKVKENGVVVTLSAGNISNVENLIGTPQDDRNAARDAGLTGDSRDNVIEGGDGADVLNGGASETDEVNGDTVSYRSSDRRVTVDLDNSTTNDGTGSQIASGGHAQGDTLAGFENVTGSAYDDLLEGDNTNNILKGLAGDDQLLGHVGSDIIEGGAGADELDGGTSAASTTNNADNGADTDSDTLSYKSSDAGVHVNLATLTFSGGHAEGDEERRPQRDAFDPDGSDGPLDSVDVSTFENITGSMHNDRLTGDHRDNVLTGGDGDDTLRGGASTTDDNVDGTHTFAVDATNELEGDRLIGGPGADILDGGEDPRENDMNIIPAIDVDGDDTFEAADGDVPERSASVDVASYEKAMAGVTVNLATGRGTEGDAMGDRLINIEKVVGSSNDDTFIAGPGPDNIDGGGHDEDDPMTGDKEDGDTVSYELSPEPVTIVLNPTTLNQKVIHKTDFGAGTAVDVAGLQGDQSDPDSYAVGDILIGIENVIGSEEDDNISGDGNANRLMGGDGKDTLTGNDGDDTLMGGAGDDTLLSGGAGDDTLMGGAGDDTMDGGSEDDTLVGGAGDDDLSGAAGTNTFVFSPEDGDGVDVIADWATGTNNKIDLSAFNIEDISDLNDLVDQRGGNTVIDLTSLGGGTIVVSDATTFAVTVDVDADGSGTIDAGEFGNFII